MVVLALTATAALLGGCWDYLDLERRGLIMAIGVDSDPENPQGLRMSVELPAPATQAEQSTEGQGGRSRKVVMQASGASVIEAANRLRGEMDREPLWTQVLALVVGESVAREGISRVLDASMRYDPLNLRALLYLTDGEAQPLLEYVPDGHSLTAMVLSSFASQAPFYPEAIRPRDLMSIHRDLRELGSAVVPRVTVAGERLHMSGGGVLHAGALVGWLDPEQTAGTNWLLGWIQWAPILFACPGHPQGQVVVLARLVGHRVDVTLAQGLPRFHVRISIAGRVVEMARCPLDLANPRELKQLADAMTGTVRLQAEKALTRAQKELQVDYLRLGEQLRRRYPQVWQALDWDAVFPETEVDIEVLAARAGIESPGLVRWAVPYR